MIDFYYKSSGGVEKQYRFNPDTGRIEITLANDGWAFMRHGEQARVVDMSVCELVINDPRAYAKFRALLAEGVHH